MVLRQLARNETRGFFEPVAELRPAVRETLELAGVTFIEETEFDEPGPTQWAAVALDDGQQYLLVHHYAHPEPFIELRVPPGESTPAEVTDDLVAALSLPEAVVGSIAKDWSR